MVVLNLNYHFEGNLTFGITDASINFITQWYLFIFCLSLQTLSCKHLCVQSPQDAVTPFQILGGEAQVVQVCELLLAKKAD